MISSGEDGVNLPVNLKRLIWNAQQLFKIKPHKKVASGAAAAMVCCYDCELLLRLAVVKRSSNVYPAVPLPASCGCSGIS